MPHKKLSSQSTVFQKDILAWYDRHRRALPWRALPGQQADLYHVWLSEIMLQQTTVPAVMGYFQKFTNLWPRLQDLAAAPEEDVMRHWAGLGYYARARNLLACARKVTTEHGGIFPRELEALKALPGIGDYTAAAIRSIGYGLPAVVVDGNVERIAARVRAFEKPLPAAKPALRAQAALLYEGLAARHGDFPQAMMDLGSSVCLPQRPRCGQCPVQAHCEAFAQGQPERYPFRTRKAAKPQRRGRVYFIRNERGEVLLCRRPEKGLLGGMTALPGGAWESAENAPAAGFCQKRDIKAPRLHEGVVRHSFTHFDLILDVMVAHARPGLRPAEDMFWMPEDHLPQAGFPTVFKKAWLFVRGEGDDSAPPRRQIDVKYKT